MTGPVGVIGVWHETNTYSGRTTTLQDFLDYEWLEGHDIVADHKTKKSVIGGFLDVLGNRAFPVFSTGAWPGGPAGRDTADKILATVTRALQQAPPLSGLVVNLHGAMVADGHPDMEGDVLSAARAVVGDVPVAAVLDLHANPSPALVASVNALIAYDTYPHVDMFERGAEAASLLDEITQGRRFRTFMCRYPVLSSPLTQSTDAEPMRGIAARARSAAATTDGVRRVSLTPGFPYSDSDRVGFTVLAVADPSAEAAANRLLRSVYDDIAAHEKDFVAKAVAPADAVRAALASDGRPVILADVADNIGGGSAGDGTALLRELAAARAAGAVITIADREVAAAAERAGVGAVLEAEVGGKTDSLHGRPFRMRATVTQLSDGRYRTAGTWMTDGEFDLGPTALLMTDYGLMVVVTSRAVPPFHAEQLTHLGIPLESATVITAKGAVAWRAAFGDVAAASLLVDTPGACPVDPSVLPRADPATAIEPWAVPRAATERHESS